jgi:hypothetical protein
MAVVKKAVVAVLSLLSGRLARRAVEKVRTRCVVQPPLRVGFHLNPATGPFQCHQQLHVRTQPQPRTPNLAQQTYERIRKNSSCPLSSPSIVVDDKMKQPGASSGSIWEHDYVWYIDGDCS